MFERLNRGFNAVFKPERLTLGLVAPVESYAISALPTMKNHVQHIQLAESLGFECIWLRDIPFNVPTFGDVGQMYDPFAYLGFLAASTSTINLGVASLILPLRHPAHIAKAAASVDALSNGRLLLGVASGDRPEEYPALNMSYEDRGTRFRQSIDYIRRMGDNAPEFQSVQGKVSGGMDMLPKPAGTRLPLLITGGSQQNPAWVAEHADGWITFPRGIAQQAGAVAEFQRNVESAGQRAKPVMQSLYIDLVENPDYPAQPIHLGFRSGVNALRQYLQSIEQVGVNHVALNLRFNQMDIDTTLHHLADHVLPDFA